MPPPDLSSAAAAVSVPAFFIGLLVNLTVRVIMVRVASEAPRLRMTYMWPVRDGNLKQAQLLTQACQQV